MKKFFKFIVILQLCLFVNCISYASDFATEYNAGYTAFSQKDYKTAVKIFENLLDQNYDDYHVYCLLGISYASTGQAEQAEKVFIKAIEKFPNEFTAYTFLADLRRAQRRYPEAIGYYKKALSLSSMPDDGRKFYENLINEVIEEQKAFDNTQANFKPNISINLDMNKWELAYAKGTNHNWLAEYGLKNEDVINYKWTQLVTVNFFSTDVYNLDIKNYYNDFINALKKTAESINSSLELEVLSQSDSEIYFIWSIKGRNEFEFCRIFQQPDGLYFGHYAQKKNSYTPVEKENILAILKSIKGPKQ